MSADVARDALLRIATGTPPAQAWRDARDAAQRPEAPQVTRHANGDVTILTHGIGLSVARDPVTGSVALRATLEVVA